jgi:hypothetical protein
MDLSNEQGRPFETSRMSARRRRFRSSLFADFLGRRCQVCADSAAREARARNESSSGPFASLICMTDLHDGPSGATAPRRQDQ